MAVQQDGAKPGEKLASPVVTAQTSPCFDEGVLREILGLCCVAAQQHGLSQQARFIHPANFAERPGIACLSQIQKISRVWNFDFHEGWIQAEHISVVIQNPGQCQRRTLRPDFRPRRITVLPAGRHARR